MPVPVQTLNLSRPGIIEASAGTGKTYTIAKIYLALLLGKKSYPQQQNDENATPGEISVRDILVVTFTNAATAELKSRLQKEIRDAIKESDAGTLVLSDREKIALKLADAEFDEASVSTINGFCTRILQDFSLECGLPPRLVPAENIDKEQLRFAAHWRSRQILLGKKEFESVPAKEISSILGEFSKFPDMSVSENAPEEKKIIATQALADWRSHRMRSDELSYNEVLTRVRDALRGNAALAEKISARYKVALVDEFQDTDPVQWEIFNRIFVSRERPFFCVGDPKQAIYEFRGGDINTYKIARETIRERSANNELRLEENFRSSPEMIDAFNEIFQLDEQIKGNLEYVPVYFPKSKSVPAEKNPYPAILRNHFSGNKTTLLESIHEALTHDIVECLHNKIEPRQIAVLCSQNEHAIKIRTRLAKLGVPAVTTARDSVLNAPEAAALADIIDAVLNPYDKYALPRAAVSILMQKRYGNAVFAGGEKLLSELREHFFETKKLWEREGFFAAFSALAEKADFASALAETTTPTRSTTNFRHLLELINLLEHKHKLGMTALAEKYNEMRSTPNLDDDSQLLRIDTDADSVQIVTMHKSKGLEYDIVFLPHLWENSLAPNKNMTFTRSISDDGKDINLIFKNETNAFENSVFKKNIATSACLFYVALTRAKRQLVVYHSPSAKSGKTPIDSYAQRIFNAATTDSGILSEPLKHWKIADAGTPLEITPKIIGAAEKKEKQTDPAETFYAFPHARERLAEDTWGVFSFSRIIGKHHDFQEESLLPDENKNAIKTADYAFSENEKVYPAPPFFSLQAGTQFGTAIHEIFEKLDYRSRENFDSVLKNAFPTAEESELRKIRALVCATLGIPLVGEWTLSQLDCSRDALREMEFFFALKKSQNLYSELNDVFHSWGGIYKRTAEFHWNGGNAGSLLRLDGLMNGFVDLVFRAGERFYIADWKTNRVMKKEETKMPQSELENEIVENGYALQWAIYAIALRKFLRKTLGKKYNHALHFGGIRYIFVRWAAVFADDEITEPMLDALESILMQGERND